MELNLAKGRLDMNIKALKNAGNDVEKRGPAASSIVASLARARAIARYVDKSEFNALTNAILDMEPILGDALLGIQLQFDGL